MASLEGAAFRWGLWLRWVLASAAGAAGSALVARPASLAAGKVAGEAAGAVGAEAATGALALGGVLLGISLAQWLVVRRHAPWGARLVLASVAGGVAGGTLGLGAWAALGELAGPARSALVGVVVGLTGFGGAQWLVMRGQVAWAPWWALASITGLAAATLGAAAAGVLVEAGVALVYGGVYGAATGGVVAWWLDSPAASRRGSLLLLGAWLIVFGADSAIADDTPNVGDRIRIRAPRLVPTLRADVLSEERISPFAKRPALIGTFAGYDSASVVLRVGQAAVHVPRDAMERVDVWSQGNYANDLAFVGALGGAVIGGLVGASREKECSESLICFDFPVLEGALDGVLIGTVVGGAIGWFLPQDRWTEVRVPSFRAVAWTQKDTVGLACVRRLRNVELRR